MSLLVKWFGLFIAALGFIKPGQVVQAGSKRWMLVAQFFIDIHRSFNIWRVKKTGGDCRTRLPGTGVMVKLPHADL